MSKVPTTIAEHAEVMAKAIRRYDNAATEARRAGNSGSRERIRKSGDRYFFASLNLSKSADAYFEFIKTAAATGSR